MALPLETLSPSQVDAIHLSRALTRLEAKILQSPPARLRFCAAERNKTRANLESARTLLLRLEHTAAQQKVTSRRHAAQSHLAKQRQTIKKLTERLHDLEAADDGTQSGIEDGDGAEDVLAVLQREAANMKSMNCVNSTNSANEPDNGYEVTNGTAAAMSTTNQDVSPELSSRTSPSEPRNQSASIPPPSSVLRSRDPRAQHSKGATTTAHSLSTSTNPPQRNSTATTSFSSPTPTALSPTSTSPFKPKDAPSSSPSKSTATALESSSSAQVELTSSMLSLAAQLKQSARSFAAELDADKLSLAKAGEGLEKSKGTMDSTTQRMGVLRKMSEGRWWWGRMVLMVGIVALWVLLVLLVFVGPKIRW